MKWRPLRDDVSRPALAGSPYSPERGARYKSEEAQILRIEGPRRALRISHVRSLGDAGRKRDGCRFCFRLPEQARGNTFRSRANPLFHRGRRARAGAR